ncbi:MAG: glutathione synthase [Gammaproteobacteria bacterium]
MTIKLAVIMDPIEGIKVRKDSTFAMLLEAQNRGYEIHYLQSKDLYLKNDVVFANSVEISVQDQNNHWFTAIKDPIQHEMSAFDVVLMRKDPPFNMEYIYTTYLLDRAEECGVLVINHPASLRNANEKLFATKFKDCITPYIVSQQQTILNKFIDEHKKVVVKPLDGMAGDSIFQINNDDANRNVILETITQLNQRTVMAQKLIPEYVQGDKRVLLINGEPIPYALLRVPSKGELRANLAKGGSAQGIELNARDKYICSQIGPVLRAMQLSFVGIDIIGEYLTEINVTSPTGIRELDKMYDLNISATLFDHIENQLNAT